MSGCCSSSAETGTGAFFSKSAKRYARKAKKGTLEKVQRLLVERIRSAGPAIAEVLDIGCGAGSIHQTLLNEGASAAFGVDLSMEMLNHAKTLAEAKGLREKVTYAQGDFVELAASIPATDVTVMDKVVCCYEDLPSLIHEAAAHTKRLLALSHPADNVFVRSLFRIQIFVSKLFRMQFRPWWHDWRDMERMIEREGLRLRDRRGTTMWSVLVYERAL